jgi:DNA-binding LacI/PurR family transcriptional regulator
VGRPNVTSADVAKAAGVSRATVSYVLNGVDARVSAETRERVLAAARELGYVPHPFASALRAGRTSVVVIALPAWPLGPPVAELISAIVGELDRLGYTPLVHFRHWSGPDGLTKACDRVRPVGLIAPARDLPPERVEFLRATGTRAVLAIAPEPPEHIPSLSFDQRLVGEVAVEHLAERGHTRIAAIMPTAPEVQDIAEPRRAGAERAAARLGLHLTVVTPEQPAPGDATAVFAFNDELALAARERRPELAIVGVDDSPAAHVAHLTTIRLVPTEAYVATARRLHALIEDEQADASPIVVRPTLIPGATT